MGIFGSIWGLLGISLLIGSAIYRLSFLAIAGFSYEFHWHHWFILVSVTLFMAYAEGFKGFQQKFSPRTAARARFLKEYPNAVRSILAPIFCMGFFHATQRRKITSISLTLGIVILVITVRFVPQPWRGIIDTGVVVGLAWGLVSLYIYSFKAFTSQKFSYSPEVPEE
jgi:hypothetical protein